MLTPEQIEARRGLINASEAHSIMTGWDTPRPTEDYPAELYDWIKYHNQKPLVKQVKGFLPCEVSGPAINAAWSAYRFDTAIPQGLVTYAETMACDDLFEPDPSLEDRPTSTHMDNGNERELAGMELLSDRTGLNFVKTGEDQIHLTLDGVGATPDGIVYDDLDLIVTGGELKARSPLHHMRQLFIVNNATLMELDFPRFVQIQIQCLVAGSSYWYTASYNPFAINPAHQLHYCVIQRDDAFLDIFKQRAALTFKIKQEFIDRVNTARPALQAA